MSLTEAYDPDNVFAKIIRGDIPSVKIAETEDTLCFMDVFPQSRGHSLVIPKKVQATNLFALNQDTLATLIGETQRIAKAVNVALKPGGIRIAQFNGEPAGQTVFHIHFHIIPVYPGEALGAHAGDGPADTHALEATAEKIIAAL